VKVKMSHRLHPGDIAGYKRKKGQPGTKNLALGHQDQTY
jgi:hypothetical protein